MGETILPFNTAIVCMRQPLLCIVVDELSHLVIGIESNGYTTRNKETMLKTNADWSVVISEDVIQSRAKRIML